MTVQEAIEAMQVEGLEITGKLSRVNEFFKGLVVAEESLKKQMALKNVLEQIEELKVAFEAGTYQEKYCLQQMLDGKCKRRDCSACVLERAIEIIKEELM